MKYYSELKKNEDYIINLRRYFHENPELSGEEFNTISRIKDELDKLGIEYVEVEKGGLIGRIKGKKGDKKVLLRADVDALPVSEKDTNLKTKRVCKSKNDGVMHACGHDGHMAMLLGAAKVLSEKRDEFQGEVILVFERGEEGPDDYRYLMAYMERENIVPDTVYGMHLYSTLEKGKIGINDGAMMAGYIFFDITLEGKGGHGSRPDLSNNPINAFTTIYNYMQSMSVSKINPYETISYSVGALNAGSVPNVIPQTLNFKGNVRFLNREKAGEPWYRDFKEKVEDFSKAFGVTPTFNKYPRPGFPVINDEVCAKFAREIFSEEFGREDVINVEPWMASESFSGYTEQWPGVFVFLGMKDEEKGFGAEHHNEYFDVNESVLAKGATCAVSYAINFLNLDIKPEQKKYKGKFREFLREIGDSEEKIEEYYSVRAK